MPLRNLDRGDRWALSILVAIPVVVFVVPALFGHPIVTGDNQIQNLPLRALAGEDLRHGHLPLWNPYIWSGSPLLGGLNAGALYPFTWLFAFLPVVAAWTANLVVVYVTAAVGMYALLRQQDLRSFAAAFAAASFAFAGAMSAQIVHLGIIQGTSWIPWMLVVEQRLARQLLGTDPGSMPVPESMPVAGSAPDHGSAPDRGSAPDQGSDRRARPSGSATRRIALLGMLGGLVLLTGEPRGMADAAVVVGLAALWHLFQRHPSWRARATFLSSVVLAALVAAALGAVQLVPGWSFIAESQRAQSTVAFFGSGSLPVRWTLLMLVPDLMGGAGVFHQPSFFSHYNLPEITGYVGVLPLVAAAALLARSFGRWRHPRARHWIPWCGLVAAGLILAYGAYTPLSPVLARLPFYGDLRLQSRNLVIAGLGLTVLLAYWLDMVLDTSGRRVPRRITRVVSAVPAMAVIVTCLVALVWSSPFELWLGTPAVAAHLGRALAPSFVATIVVAAAAGLIGLGYHRLGPRLRPVALGGVIVVDLVLFSLTSVTGMNLNFLTADLPTTSSAVPVVAKARFAIDDPEDNDLTPLSKLGQTDLNALVHRPSVQGYGSLTDNGYQSATGTRTDNTMSPCALALGTFVPLDLRTLLALPDHLVTRLGAGAHGRLHLAVVPDDTCSGTAPPSNERVWWFGQPLSVTAASVSFSSDPPAPASLRVGVLLRSGAIRWTAAAMTPAGDDVAIRFPSPERGQGLVLSGNGSARATDATSVTTARGTRYVMDGDLQSALRDASFHLTGYRGPFAVFRTDVARPPVSLVAGSVSTATASSGTSTGGTSSGGTSTGGTSTGGPSTGGPSTGGPSPGSAALGTARLVTTTPWGEETDAVTARRTVTLVRSEAFASGWQAAVRDVTTGRTRTLRVVRVGLVEGVHLGAGTYTVVWTYRPVSVTAGLLCTLVAVALLAVAGVTWLGSRRRLRPTPSSSVNPPATRRGSPARSRATTRV